MDGEGKGIEILPEEVTSQEIPEHKKPWYEQPYWKEKGDPVERVQMGFGNHDITVCNFNRQIFFSRDFEERSRRAIDDVSGRFPSVLDRLKWILIDDEQALSLFNDEDKYPQNGRTLHSVTEEAMVLEPRAFEDISHRIVKVPNFEGTLVHELGHQLDSKLEVEWKEKFPWIYAGDNEEDWVFDKSGGKDILKLKPPVNKLTGDIAIGGRYPSRPEECVTGYARINEHEDASESLVAYIYDPDGLKQVSNRKFEALKSHDMATVPTMVS